MKQINYKKLILPNIPYVFFVYLFDKVGQAARLAPGADISEKILNITQGFSEAFSNALPSVHPLDLLIGIVGADRHVGRKVKLAVASGFQHPLVKQLGEWFRHPERPFVFISEHGLPKQAGVPVCVI